MSIPEKLTVIQITTEENGRITSVNNYGCRILGYKNTEDCKGIMIQDLYAHPVDRDLYLKRLKTDGYVKDFEIRLKTANDSVITCLENAVLVRDEMTGAEYIESFITDISGFVDTNIATIKLNIQLADLNKKLKDAYNTMSQQEKLASVGELAAELPMR